MHTTIATTDLITKIREVAAEQPDFVYGDEYAAESCEYATINGESVPEPACLVGHGFARLGLLDYVANDEWNERGVREVLTGLFNLVPGGPDAQWLFIVQSMQDSGSTWADAVKAADKGWNPT